MENRIYSSWVLERIGIREVIRLREGLTRICREGSNFTANGENNFVVIAVDSNFCSRKHCEIRVNGEEIELTDFSMNGTYVNDTKFCKITVALKECNIIGIGCKGDEATCRNDPKICMYILRRKPLFKAVANDSCESGRSVDNRTLRNQLDEPQPSTSGTNPISNIEESDSEDNFAIRRTSTKRKSRAISSSSSSSSSLSDNEDRLPGKRKKICDLERKSSETNKILLSMPREMQPIVRIQRSVQISQTHPESICRSSEPNLVGNSNESDTKTTNSKDKCSLKTNVADKRNDVSSDKANEEIIILDSDDDTEVENITEDKLIKSEESVTLNIESKPESIRINNAEESTGKVFKGNIPRTISENGNEEVILGEANITGGNEKKDVSKRKSITEQSGNSHVCQISNRIETKIVENSFSKTKELANGKKIGPIDSDEVNTRPKHTNSDNHFDKNQNLDINKFHLETIQNPEKIKDIEDLERKENDATNKNIPESVFQDADFCELLNFVDEIKSEPIADPDEILEISDDNLEMQLSQHYINEIKQEVGNFELEESFNHQIDVETIECDADDNLLPQSPMFEEEDVLNDTVSKWVMKLSQTPAVKIKAEPREFEDANDYFEEPKEVAKYLLIGQRASTKKSEAHIDEDISKSEASVQKETCRDCHFIETKKKIESLKLKNPEIISAPSLPICRGKRRGVSAVSPSTKLRKELTEGRAKKFRASERQFRYEADMKQKWLQKPAVEREKQIKKRIEIQSNRKEKLREIANAQARKRKHKDDDVKVVNKVKVKITEKNRGAFLTENAIPEKQKKVEGKSSTFVKCSSSNNHSFPETVTNGEYSVQDGASKSETKTIDTVSALKIKNRISRVNSTINDRIELGSNLLIKEYDFNKTEGPNLIKNTNTTKNTLISNNIFTEKDKSIQVGKLKSILKYSTHPKCSKKKKKTVRFCEKLHDIVYFQIEENVSLGRKVDCKDIKIDMQKFMQNFKGESHYNLADYSEKILTDILHWDPVKLEKRKELFESELKLLPMVHKFSSIDHFIKTVFPLMKMELWATLQSDMDNLKDIPYVLFRIKSSVREKRGEYDRLVCVFDCLTHSNSFPCNVGDLGIVHAKSHKEVKLFAFVKQITKLNSPNINHWQVTLDMKNSFTFKDVVDKAKEIKYKTISQIKVELGTFNAVYNLNISPLKNIILSPSNIGNNVQPSVDKLLYRGYDELNEGQKVALLRTYAKVINKEHSNICLIEGPPGTGKSHVISNLALQILYGEGRASSLKKKLLICAQSNTAIDVIAQKLLHIRTKMGCNRFNLIRFGILERMHPQVQPISVQNLVKQYLRTQSLNRTKDIFAQEISFLKKRLADLSTNENENSVVQEEIKILRKRLETLGNLQTPILHSAEVEKEYPRFLNGAHIVCTTLASCIKLLQYTNMFDICIIDEATQCSEPWSLIPLQFGVTSLVLVGDTQQLPATLLSKNTEKYEYGRSLFTRIKNCLESNPDSAIESLSTQYRMHPNICQWPNSYFYNNRLLNGKCTTDFQLQIKPYSVINLEFKQNMSKNGIVYNSLEAEFIKNLLQSIFPLVQPKFYTFGIITPYAEQRAVLTKVLIEHGIKDIPVNTIDSYQGKEKDVIIISNARTKGTGFLVNSQRLNVALTRAKKVLILCGNFTSLEKITAWKSLLDDAKKRKVFYHVTKSDAMNFNEKVLPKIFV